MQVSYQREREREREKERRGRRDGIFKLLTLSSLCVQKQGRMGRNSLAFEQNSVGQCGTVRE